MNLALISNYVIIKIYFIGPIIQLCVYIFKVRIMSILLFKWISIFLRDGVGIINQFLLILSIPIIFQKLNLNSTSLTLISIY